MVHEQIESLLAPYNETIGRDFVHYSNHVHRIVNFAFGLKNEQCAGDAEKIVIAAVFHDIGLWTNNSFDYLKPSIKAAQAYLKANGKIEWTEEISLMIDMHHKRSKYYGAFADNVEAFRKADLVDLTKGRKGFNLSKSMLTKNFGEFPMGRFRKIIISRFLRNLLTNPFRPLPMFKK